MEILVTGGLGFVGSTLVDTLVKSNYSVTVIDNLSSTSSSILYKNKLVTYIIDDIRNIKQLKFKNSFDIIYHLAGLARIQPSFNDPLSYIDINVNGTAIICEVAREHNAKLIYSSSSSINNGEYQTPYTFSKWGGEEVLKTWRWVLKKLVFQRLRQMGYSVTTGIIFIRLFRYECRIKRS